MHKTSHGLFTANERKSPNFIPSNVHKLIQLPILDQKYDIAENHMVYNQNEIQKRRKEVPDYMKDYNETMFIHTLFNLFNLYL